jgi:hypothetical protein
MGYIHPCHKELLQIIPEHHIPIKYANEMKGCVNE